MKLTAKGSVTVRIGEDVITYDLPTHPTGLWLTVRCGRKLVMIQANRNQIQLKEVDVKTLSKAAKEIARTLVGEENHNTHPPKGAA